MFVIELLLVLLLRKSNQTVSKEICMKFPGFLSDFHIFFLRGLSDFHMPK